MSTVLTSDLLRCYADLDSLEKRCVQLVALNGGDITRTAVAKSLNELGEQSPTGKRINTVHVTDLLKPAIEGGLIKERTRLCCAEPVIESIVRDVVVSGQFELLASAVRKAEVLRPNPDTARALRELRYHLYTGDDEAMWDAYSRVPASCPAPLERVFGHPFDAAWLQPFPDGVRVGALRDILYVNVRALRPSGEVIASLKVEVDRLGWPMVKALYIDELILHGRLDEAESILAELEEPESRLAWLALIRGDRERALVLYRTALKREEKRSGSKAIVFATLGGLFYPLALISSSSAEDLDEAGVYLRRCKRQRLGVFSAARDALSELLRVRLGPRHLEHVSNSTLNSRGPNDHVQSIDGYFWALAETWTGSPSNAMTAWLQSGAEAADSAGYFWLASELSYLAPKVEYIHKVGRPLARLYRRKPRWETKLDALLEAIPTPVPAAKKADRPKPGSSRLIWTIGRKHHELTPREQRQNKAGQWSKGRPIALKRLYDDLAGFPFLTAQDKRVCTSIVRDTSQSWGRYVDVSYHLSRRALVLLVAHPLVFWEEDRTSPVQVALGTPQLSVAGKGDGHLLRVLPAFRGNTVSVVAQGDGLIEVFILDEQQGAIAELIGADLYVPDGGKEKLEAVIKALSRVFPLQSDLLSALADAEVTSASTKLILRVRRAGEAFEVQPRVRPLETGGPFLPPGRGGKAVVAVVGGRRVKTERDLVAERAALESVVEACPSLGDAGMTQTTYRLPTVDACLSMLMELEEVEDGVVSVEWPQGEPLELGAPRDVGDLGLKIGDARGAFSLDGALKVDSEREVPLGEILGLLEATPSRFIPIGDGRYIALTEMLRGRLREMAHLVRRKRGSLQFDPHNAPSLMPLLEGAGSLASSQKWRRHAKRVAQAMSRTPQVPKTLDAELRDYQLDGFRWLSRLSSWGAGACLADDMGLGKTVQTLALLLERGQEGPALVVAPTSVGGVWIDEARRFAPTLRLLRLGPSHREETLAQLGPRTVLVCSYGLLTSEVERLGQISWATVVLDEAQAIKNPTTKRHKAAVSLVADARVILTGTPIENHLGELWSLFAFLNPGLLGSRNTFNTRFLNPIQKENDRQQKRALRRLILPFMLRRRKAEVLRELPPRTDIDLSLEMSGAEAALYEAMRREALAELASEGADPRQRMRILGWITRLRQVCCHPSLAGEVGRDLPSCKLEAFGELVETLRDNGHRALVFSQFVTHLTILREWLDAKGVAYQYLDGSTSTSAREEAVRQFQGGEGDLFLISLRAGGFGLNLTAADYVIHTDPWWNPAVEDQASDRAHRIGQERPVTVYRLVTRGTIEAQIVALHRRKREIADSLLAGADVAGQLSTEDLMALILE